MNHQQNYAHLPPDQLLSPDAAAIAYVKRAVGVGDVYENEAARAIFSDRGGYYELKGMPEEFSGALGIAVNRRTATRLQVTDFLTTASLFVAAPAVTTDLTWQLSLVAVYAGADLQVGEGMFVYDRALGGECMTSGQLIGQPLPLFFKMRFSATRAVPALADLLQALGLAADVSNAVVFGIAPASTDDGHFVIGHFARDGKTVDLGSGARAASYQGLMPQ